MRRIAGTKDGAFTRAHLLAKVKAPEEKEHKEELKRQERAQKTMLRQLKAKEAIVGTSQPRLRRRGAARAKAEQEARAREHLASLNAQDNEKIQGPSRDLGSSG
jgi:hypothetical protein